MKCHEVRRYLAPYLDSELDQTTTYEICRHLEDCTPCSTLFEDEETLDRAIFESLNVSKGDEETVFAQAIKRSVASSRHPLSVSRLARASLLLMALVLSCLVLLARHLLLSHREETNRRGPALVELAIIDLVRREHRATLDGSSRAAFDATASNQWHWPHEEEGLGTAWEMSGSRTCRFRETALDQILLLYHEHEDAIPVSVFLIPRLQSGPTRDLRRHREKSILPEGRLLVQEFPPGHRIAIGDLSFERLHEALSLEPEPPPDASRCP